jgi:hypothetical protein
MGRTGMDRSCSIWPMPQPLVLVAQRRSLGRTTFGARDDYDTECATAKCRTYCAAI